MYPLVYGDDVDALVVDGIPENDTSDTSYRIVSTNPMLRVLILVILTEPKRANERQADKRTDPIAQSTGKLRRKGDVPVDADFDGHIGCGLEVVVGEC